MKYKLIYIAVAVCLLITAIFATYSKIDQTHKSEFQHLNSKKEENSKTDEYQTHLPIVKIDTKNIPIEGTKNAAQYSNAEVMIIDKESKMNKRDDKADVKTQALIKVRGNSSFYFEKKSYDLKFVNQNEANKVQVMGMPKNDDWVLNGPFLDKSLMRNYLAMNISSEIMGYAPRVRFCEVFLNEKYQGLYLMMEPISQGEKRIPISKVEKDNDYTSYILRMDRGSLNEYKNINNFSKYTLGIPLDKDLTHYRINIDYPTSKNLTDSKKEYIEKDFSQFEKTLYSFDYNTGDYGYQNYIDVNSFVDYYIINEFFQNYDAVLFSTYLYKDLRGKINIGPVWDFNNSMDNYVEGSNPIEQTMLEQRLWYTMLFKDEKFVEKVLYRYKELRKTALNEKNLLKHIDDIETYLGSAIERNFDVWGFSFDYSKVNHFSKLLPKERNITSHEEAVLKIKEFIVNRGRWLDNNIEYLKQYSHESKTKQFRR